MHQKKITLYAGCTAALLIAAGLIIYNIWEIPHEATKESEDTRKTEIPSDITDGETYTHHDPSFSLRYPKGFHAGSNQNTSTNGGETVVIERGDNESFQISIAPFDEEGPITKERIVRDLPDTPISEEDSTIIVGSAHAFGFVSTDETIGETYEIWFVAGGNLYQISTPLSFKETLMQILSTWKFGN